MIEDLPEGILQGVCPLDTARLGVVRQNTDEAREMVDVTLHHLAGTRLIKIEEIQVNAGEIIRQKEGILLSEEENRLIEGGIHRTGEENRHLGGIRRTGEESLHPGDTRRTEGEIRRLEDIHQIEGRILHLLLEEILLKDEKALDTLQREEIHLILQIKEIYPRLEKITLQREAPLLLEEVSLQTGGNIRRKERGDEKNHQKNENHQFGEKVLLNAKKILRIVERSLRKERRVLQAIGYHLIKGKDPLIAKRH